MTFRRGLTAVARLVLLGLVFAAGSPALAQTTSASVSGVVQDSQGAFLPGVTVTLTSQTQGQTLTTTTDGEGRFTFAIVRPDTYSLQASLQGFKTVERTKVVVNANDRLSTGTMVLEVGVAHRRNHRDRARDRAADERRRTVVRARERGAQEHRQRRTLRSSALPRWCPASCRRQATAAPTWAARPRR